VYTTLRSRPDALVSAQLRLVRTGTVHGRELGSRPCPRHNQNRASKRTAVSAPIEKKVRCTQAADRSVCCAQRKREDKATAHTQADPAQVAWGSVHVTRIAKGLLESLKVIKDDMPQHQGVWLTNMRHTRCYSRLLRHKSSS
jgi:hypothetical protein